jgi:mono/diheme cytochrome c family protein
MKRYHALTLAAVLAVSACKKEKTFDPPDRAERVTAAEERYSESLFDSVAWESDLARSTAGNMTYAAKCRNCHGTLGEGGTPYAGERGLNVPSLVEPDWPWADSLNAVRHRVFVGHESGMPTWGVAGITPREIDGAAYYVLEVLRPEVLEVEH